MLKEIVFNSEYFNAKDTLECGQIFRFFQIDNGYLVLSGEKACILNTVGDKTTILCESENEEYFYNYFDFQPIIRLFFHARKKASSKY